MTVRYLQGRTGTYLVCEVSRSACLRLSLSMARSTTSPTVL
ncbi:Uncharacterised protein [Mycobacteroides abscessus]|nr:Uncharacterised protein [Mycobacteroides abscessus]SKU56882.1 Uncharacterised protein [Mycobacteroides abscessus subsp. abscessus]